MRGEGEAVFAVGAQVFALYADGNWYGAVVARRRGDRYVLHWDDGDVQDRVKGAHDLCAPRDPPRQGTCAPGMVHGGAGDDALLDDMHDLSGKEAREEMQHSSAEPHTRQDTRQDELRKRKHRGLRSRWAEQRSVPRARMLWRAAAALLRRWHDCHANQSLDCGI